MICGGECGAFNPLIIECLLDISDDLERELQTNTSGIKSKMGIQEVTDELLNSSDLSVSGQMLRQIEFERGRADFFEEELSGIGFSFRSDPPVLSLSEKGAEKIGLPTEVAAPLDSPEVRRSSDGSLEKLPEKISHARPTDPDVRMNGHIIIGGRAAECEFRCRTIWLSSDDRTFSKLT